MSVRILHAADLHLDSPFEALTLAQAAQRRREQRSLLRALPELAQAHGVRAAYPSFGIEYIQNVLQTNINSAFFALA